MKLCVVLMAVTVMASLSSAIVCPPNICDHVTKPVLNCKGGVFVKGGFCGCTDTCARVEGETCSTIETAVVTQGDCDLGLKCIRKDNMAQGTGICGTTRPDVDLGYHRHGKREDGHTRTLCEQMRLSSMISMVVFQGQWFAKCDNQGNFMPMQCDNTQHCFCVNTKTGEVMEGSKVLGAANCSSSA